MRVDRIPLTANQEIDMTIEVEIKANSGSSITGTPGVVLGQELQQLDLDRLRVKASKGDTPWTCQQQLVSPVEVGIDPMTT